VVRFGDGVGEDEVCGSWDGEGGCWFVEYVCFPFMSVLFGDGVGQNLQSVPSISKTIPCNAGAPSVAGWPRGAKRRLLGCCEDAILIAANREIVGTLLGLKGVLQKLFRSFGFSVCMDIAVIKLVKFKKCCQ
jgi:hypothetical protein